MGLRDSVAAKLRGDVSTKDLIAYGRAGSDAYDLLDQLPALGYARLCAWNAFVLQTYGDKLLEAGESPGFASPETAHQVAVLYEFVGSWLARARQAAATEDYRLDVYVPQGLPHQWNVTPLTLDQLAGMRDTLQAAQARLVSDLGAFKRDTPARERLESLALAVASDAEYVDKLWTQDPGPDLRATLGETLEDGLDRAYRLGQVLAVPDLLAELHDEPPPAQRSGAQLRLPGEPGFDPWCLTDPMERQDKESVDVFLEHINAMWAADPHPERTLAIRAEIDKALAEGVVDYLPTDGLGQLTQLAGHCPWPGILTVKAPVMIGGSEVEAGEKFVFTVSHDDGDFERAIVVEPATYSPPLEPDLPDPVETAGEKAFDACVRFGLRVDRF